MKMYVPRAVAVTAVLCCAASGFVVAQAQQSPPPAQQAPPPAQSQQAAAPAANATLAATNPTGRVIYPSKGQTPEQQQKDQQECYNWAVQQTGFDPVVAKQQLNQTGQQAQGNVDATQGQAVKGAARGAVAGVAIGAIAGDAGKGAAIGATAGGLAGGMKRRDQAAAEQSKVDQAAQQYQQGLEKWDRAFTACLQGREYTVN
jgi:YmgG-like glycine-zipper protein